MMDMTGRAHGQRRASHVAATAGLRALLWSTGHGLVLATRCSAALRSQITRGLTVEISSDDGPARHWDFDGQRRRVSTSSGRAASPDLAVRFTSSCHALRDLLSPDAIDAIMRDRIDGTVRVEGNHLLLMWFRGLLRKVVPIGGPGNSRRALPGAYVAHDPAANGVETIIIEPAVRQLDPQWTGAWNARARLWIVRGTNGEPLREP
ncbi:hypothetical protein FNV62_06240 [Streptomyces sp. RLB3-17]|uniref:hypothetical protein n=1 Tax=unclassified Streptomyces TaxID=2593676 RepID=UPI0011648B9D|nr:MULTISPECIES: hypothetical protein [unclassified Streptomyces]NMI55831.1 hypothetical protein [Streptomyces sp. RLA2-12]QDN55306.1 hypothetical protein FNV67_08145 [Streptomyces sp. S1D4-20]QDN65485.1 hypothetical protein FNV66_07745 [Streptomyces sp. S1D4-14]QDN75837.1 hypothetical protein FNV64_09805 [Streptomyces sp. S1A1-7]QDN85494.1 hypothetical protein FNV61_07435 [Streptomyces sp. RLB3-6]